MIHVCSSEIILPTRTLLNISSNFGALSLMRNLFWRGILLYRRLRFMSLFCFIFITNKIYYLAFFDSIIKTWELFWKIFDRKNLMQRKTILFLLEADCTWQPQYALEIYESLFVQSHFIRNMIKFHIIF